ncbi:hypothetical protein [Serratia marcescens]|uniref:hypothetical protein n=1 Tax=Serratia marcescens TaxID=615 RepID=UPI00235EFA78|nr:hypothetical protein [Serratia marcescens]
MNIIETNVDRLCNMLRLLAETAGNLNRLKHIDLEEAVNNFDRTFEGVLEAFHSLYDVTKYNIDYFEHADTALIILLRNAIHHRDHPLFKSWNAEMNLNKGYKNYIGAEFLLCSYVPIEKDAHVMKYYYKLADIYDRIDQSRNSPYLVTRISTQNMERQLSTMNSELGFNKICQYATEGHYPLDQIYINIAPILQSGIKRVFTDLNKKQLSISGFDSDVYFSFFQKHGFFRLEEIIYFKQRIYLLIE